MNEQSEEIKEPEPVDINGMIDALRVICEEFQSQLDGGNKKAEIVFDAAKDAMRIGSSSCGMLGEMPNAVEEIAIQADSISSRYSAGEVTTELLEDMQRL